MSLILINTSNLHVGGGVQVAVSFIDELSRSNHNLKLYDLWVSEEVYQNLLKINTDLKKFNSFEVINLQGIYSLFSIKLLYYILFKYKTVFTLFGPLYVMFKPKYHVLGFAMPSVIYSQTALDLEKNLLNRYLSFLKIKVQEFFFSKSDVIIVELEHVKIALESQLKFRNIPIRIVHNCFSNVFLDPQKWLDLNFPRQSGINIGYLGRNYPHKNLVILPEVLNILRYKFKINVNFYVTLTESEWKSCSFDFRKSIINVGSLSLAQCPSYFKELDGIILPSLLECFSATPLEALIMGKPIFLSDRQFNKDVIGDYGIYFDPLDVFDISNSIYNYFSSNSYNNSSKEYASSFSNARDRMEEYIKILNT
jgi:glycosyltransferase involved in cell wall biosynthesis